MKNCDLISKEIDKKYNRTLDFNTRKDFVILCNEIDKLTFEDFCRSTLVKIETSENRTLDLQMLSDWRKFCLEIDKKLN